MLLAEELECDWSKIRTEFAQWTRRTTASSAPHAGRVRQPEHPHFLGPSAPGRRHRARDAGQAAAQKWGVDKSQCRAENSSVVNTATNARLSYGSLADAAAKLPPPANVALKDSEQFKLIGTSPKRLDTPLKVNGKAQFGIDVRVPGMLYAVLERCPVFGGKVASFDATQGEGRPRREAGGADFERRGRDRRQHLVRDGGPQGARKSSGTKARWPTRPARPSARCSPIFSPNPARWR